jgi:hypothetical protein
VDRGRDRVVLAVVHVLPVQPVEAGGGARTGTARLHI